MPTAATGRAPSRFWPFTPRTTLLIAVLVLVALLAAWGLLRDLLHFDRVEAGAVLAGIVALSVLPILMLLLEGIGTGGGSIEIGQVKVDLTAAARAQVLTVAPPNVAASEVIGDSGSHQIIEGLKRSRASRTVVVDLEEGHAWWESRLLILCEGAVRLGQPQVVVFTATRSGRVRQFVGWAHPAAIQRRLLDADPGFAAAHDSALGLALAARQTHGLAAGNANPAGNARPQALLNKQFIVYPGGIQPTGVGRLNEFLEEQLLADALAPSEIQGHREITVSRLEELLAPVLRKGYVDRTDPDAEWFRKALRSDEEYLAVTDAGTYQGLMSRAQVVTEVLLALAGPKK